MNPQAIEDYLRRAVYALLEKEVLSDQSKNAIIDLFNRTSSNLVNQMIENLRIQPRQLQDQDFYSVATQFINAAKNGMCQSYNYMPMNGMGMAPMRIAQPMMGYGMPMGGYPVGGGGYMSPGMTSYGMMTPGIGTSYGPMVGGQNSYGMPASPQYQGQQQTQNLYQNFDAKPAQQQQKPAPANVTPRGSVVQNNAAPPMQINPTEVIQTTDTSALPVRTNMRKEIIKAPYTISTAIYNYQSQTNGKNTTVIIAKTDDFVADPISTLRALMQKKKADDASLICRPFKLIASDLVETQKAFISIKKIINNNHADVSEKIEKITTYLNNTTRGIGKIVEDALLEAFNAFNLINPTRYPEVGNLECLESPDSDCAKCTLAAFEELCKFQVYDPASSQLTSLLKDGDTLTDMTYTELKKDKEKFAEWSKSHCVLVYPMVLYRITAIDPGMTNLDIAIGYSDTTPAGDDLEFFTMNAIKESDCRKSVMLIQDGKKSITLNGVIINDGGYFARFA